MPSLARHHDAGSTAFELTIAQLQMIVDQVVKLYQSEVEAVRSEIRWLKQKGDEPILDAKEASLDMQLPSPSHLRDAGSGNTEIAGEAQGNVISNVNSTNIEDEDKEASRDTPKLISFPSLESFDVAHSANSDWLNSDAPTGAMPVAKEPFRTRELWMFEPWMHGVNIMSLVVAEKAARRQTDSQFECPMPTLMAIKEAEHHLRGRWYILLPNSRFLSCWIVVCMAFLLYDLVVLPIDLCFDMQAPTFQQGLDFTSAAVWTVDMVLSFFTSVRNNRGLEVRLAEIRRRYMKSWFPFDIFVLTADYTSLIITQTSKVSSGYSISLLRAARVRRFVNIFRVARILRLSKLKTMMRRSAILMHMPRTYVQLTNGWIGISILLILCMHFLSCAWYALGHEVEGGWVTDNNLGSAGVGQLYAISLHWSFSRMHGLASNFMLGSTLELIVDTVLIYMSLITASCYTSVVVTLYMARVNANTRILWKLSASYATRHAISSDLNVRVLKFLESLSCAGAREILQEEGQLLHTLPLSLRNDLLFEARVPFMLTKPFMRDSYLINARVVFRICIDAIQVRVFSEEEVIWAHGDKCHWMLFLADGRLSYMNDTHAHSRLSRLQPKHLPMVKMQHVAVASRGSQFICKTLEAGASISEATLWTNWTHIWRLVASMESTTLTLDPDAFAASISVHKTPTIHATKYARRFVKCLNSVVDADDMVVFDDLSIEQLDDAEDVENAGDLNAHFMFLSHYKVEAGTEATLMRELLTDILSQNPSHPAHDFHSPIFIDSEDLSDLAGLREHVEKTTAFVLLLTPGVLSRPWCLVELVTAVNHDVEIVLVDIQRPGSRYSYPDDEFYADLLAGKFLSQGSVDLLQSEGITLHDVEKTLRQVFLKIALPFSPHKTKTIREAELLDILNRCSSGNEAPKVICRQGSLLTTAKSLATSSSAFTAGTREV